MISITQRDTGIEIEQKGIPLSQEEFLKILANKNRSWIESFIFKTISLMSLLLLVTASMAFLSHMAKSGIDIKSLASGFIIIGVFYSAYAYTKSKTRIKIVFNIDSGTKKEFNNFIKLYENYESFFSSSFSRHIAKEEQRKNSGAKQYVDIKKSSFKNYKKFKSNFKLLFSSFNNSELIFTPLFALYKKDKNFKIIDYKSILRPTQQSILLKDVPKNSQILSTTWEKVNKDGSKDKRYKDNFEVYSVKYFTTTIYDFQYSFYDPRCFNILKDISQTILSTNIVDKPIKNESNIKNTSDEPKKKSNELLFKINIALLVIYADKEVKTSELNTLSVSLEELKGYSEAHKLQTLKDQIALFGQLNLKSQIIEVLNSAQNLSEKILIEGVRNGFKIAIADEHFHTKEEEALILAAKATGLPSRVILAIKATAKKSRELENEFKHLNKAA